MTVSATVTCGDSVYEIPPDAPVTFGRAEDRTIRLGHTDTSISRTTGQVEQRGSRFWLTNQSKVPIGVRDSLGLQNKVGPGQEYALTGPSAILITGSQGPHTLIVDVPEVPTPPRPGQVDGEPTDIGDGVVIREDDRKALVALFAGYMDPRAEPIPRTYEAAASRLGWPRTTLIKRIEYLRTRLTKAGVPDLNGPDALSNLAEYVLARGTIRPTDLEHHPDLRPRVRP